MDENQTTSLKRCAIYTRKSTNHLLDRDINSLVTQRETCSAYIKSQRYRGWVELPRRYDDGGHSGSGLERPALAELMKDIEGGDVDSVVIYKIDRLTRSLLDFVRLIEIFDRQGIALVSISQAFDTSDSMGRMILNILLTFSQSERELIAERVRDSIRTRKRHGKVHGGLPPFGYDWSDDGIQIVEEEAEIVRYIFSEFLRTERYTTVMTAVREAGLCSAIKFSKKGLPRGGKPLNPSTVYSIIRSPIYVGEIQGHDQTYEGRHEPIISRETWDAAQALSAVRKKPIPHAKQTNHFLAGLLGRNYRLGVYTKRLHKWPCGLTQRRGLFHVRKRVPSSLRLAVGKHELWRSLDTDSLAVALRRFHQAIAWIEGELDRARKIVGGTVVSTLSGPWRDGDHEVATRVQRAARPNVLEGSQSAAIELTLAQVFERFMRDPTRDWSPRTTLAYETTRRLALSIIGDKPMSGLTRATCREFVETLRYLPKSASKRFPGLTLREDAT